MRFVAWLLPVVLGGTFVQQCNSQSQDTWPFAGNDLTNTRNGGNDGPSTRSVAQLRSEWAFTTAGDVSATPTTDGSYLYAVDWGGYLYKLGNSNGQLIWSHKISDYTGNPNSVSRTSPAIQGDTLIIGDQASATILAVNTINGTLLWKRTVDTHPLAIITSSPVIYNTRLYVGVSSNDEGFAPGVLPSFRGSFVALDLFSGNLIWQTSTVPVGYTGGAVWGSTPAIDTTRQTVFVATGNNYSVPVSVIACLVVNEGNPIADLTCLAPNDYVDSVLALDMNTGNVKWNRRLGGVDVWNDSCISPGGVTACPVPTGSDYDFGSGPNLFTVGRGRSAQEIVGAGEKSGVYWALNPDNGNTIWSTVVGPGGINGGILWGSASDGNRVYVALGNSNHATYTLTPSGIRHNGGSWAALDAKTGRILWQVKASGMEPANPTLPARALGAVAISNGVMYAGSMSGDMVALNASTGATLWRYPSGGSVIDGPAIVDTNIYWGSGYSLWGAGSPNNKLYMFSIPAQN